MSIAEQVQEEILTIEEQLSIELDELDNEIQGFEDHMEIHEGKYNYLGTEKSQIKIGQDDWKNMVNRILLRLHSSREDIVRRINDEGKQYSSC